MTQPPAPQPADGSPIGVQSPSADSRTKGPSSPPTHALAKGPVLRPAHYVEGFVREFLRELNFGQGVSLNRSTVNDQYLALARTVRHYLMADWLETARRRRETRPKMVGAATIWSGASRASNFGQASHSTARRSTTST